MNDNPKSIEYLRHLATLHDGAADDPACICCAWAADEIERLRKVVLTMERAAKHFMGPKPKPVTIKLGDCQIDELVRWMADDAS